jgi:hypothetical protein
MTQQTELPLSVAICAWCRPDVRGTSLGAVSHGICPKHLRKLKLQLLGQAGPRPSRSNRGGRADGDDPLLFPRF